MFHENKLVVDCKEKAELSIFSSKQCTIIKNDSQLLHEFLSKISGHLSDAFFTADEIAKMIKNLHLEKTYGHDMINICMLKPCGISIFKALELIFKSCLVNGVFSLEWKKANVVPVHKKNEKESLKHYRPISLRPICSKIFECLLYNNMDIFFNKNYLNSRKQSGFKPGCLCITSFGERYEFHDVFLDISKVFTKV